MHSIRKKFSTKKDKGKDGKRLPTKKGITFSPKVLDAVVEGLVQIQNNINKDDV